MVELTRSNDPVFLSWLTMRLAEEEVDAIVLDGHTAVVEGSIGAIQRRVMVAADDLARARLVLHEAATL
ncbi:MAG: DUF2007 domain-containing protein [Rhodospirillaceae bacterium]